MKPQCLKKQQIDNNESELLFLFLEKRKIFVFSLWKIRV